MAFSKPGSYLFAQITSLISHSDHSKIRQMSKSEQIPISTLIARAVCNELACKNPFAIDLALPLATPHETSPESIQLHAFIELHPNLSLEHLIILKNDIGISDSDVLKAAYAQLLVDKMIEELESTSKFEHHKGYKVCRILKVKPSHREKAKGRFQRKY